MKRTLGPCPCQGCGALVWYVAKVGWCDMDDQRHECDATPARLMRLARKRQEVIEAQQAALRPGPAEPLTWMRQR